jgi:hypothetical protein
MVSIRRYRKQRMNPDMKEILRRRTSRKEIWFSSMTVNICNTHGNSGCID